MHSDNWYALMEHSFVCLVEYKRGKERQVLENRRPSNRDNSDFFSLHRSDSYPSVAVVGYYFHHEHTISNTTRNTHRHLPLMSLQIIITSHIAEIGTTCAVFIKPELCKFFPLRIRSIQAFRKREDILRYLLPARTKHRWAEWYN